MEKIETVRQTYDRSRRLKSRIEKGMHEYGKRMSHSIEYLMNCYTEEGYNELVQELVDATLSKYEKMIDQYESLNESMRSCNDNVFFASPSEMEELLKSEESDELSLF